LAPKDELEVGETLNLEARVRSSDGNEKDIGKSVEWVSRIPEIAAFDLYGQILARRPGQVEVFARLGSLTSPAVTFTVNQARVAETPAAASIVSLALRASKHRLKVNERTPVRLLAKLSDGTENEISRGVEWRTSDPSTAAINPEGVVRGLKGGKTYLGARYGGVEAQRLLIEVHTDGGANRGRKATMEVPAGTEEARPAADQQKQPELDPSQRRSRDRVVPDISEARQGDAVPSIPSRDPRAVISEYIQSERQRTRR
jgi:hypothetical protein